MDRRRAPTVVSDRWNPLNLYDLLGITKSGENVDAARAMTVSSVFAAVNIIAGSIASLPLHVYRRGDGVRIPVEGENVVSGRPNPEVSRSIFWETAIGHAVLNGNTYLYVVGNGRPQELWPIEPGRVTVERKSGRKVYTVDGTKELTDWRAGGEVVHVQGFGTDGLVGLSPIGLARESLGLALASEKYGSSLFKHGGNPSGILSVEGTLTREKAAEYREMWTEAYGGSANVHKTAVLGQGMKWTAVSMNPEDAQMLETRRFQVNDIARWFRIPAEMIGGVMEANSLQYANNEDRIQSFVMFTLQPWITRFEQTLSDELLPADLYCRFDLRGFLRGNSEQRAKFYEILARIQAITPNEIRELEEFPPLPGGDVPVSLGAGNDGSN